MIGIIAAMPIEIQSIKNLMTDIKTENVAHIKFFSAKINQVHCITSVCGPGKVNAAICTQIMISKYAPEFILNIGVAGSLRDNIKIGDFLLSDYVVQHDIDTTAIGDNLGLIPGINMIKIPCSKKINDQILNSSKELAQSIHIGTVATGDQFIASKEKLYSIRENFNASACEMEAGSIGQVCFINNVEFSALKIISDSADNQSPFDYDKFKFTVSQKNEYIIKNLLKYKRNL